jgi:hypothetical protein
MVLLQRMITWVRRQLSRRAISLACHGVLMGRSRWHYLRDAIAQLRYQCFAVALSLTGEPVILRSEGYLYDL